MRVLFILPDLRGGGAQYVVAGLANWLSKSENFNVALAVFHRVGPVDKVLSSEVAFFDLGVTRTLLGWQGLRRTIQGFQPDVTVSSLTYVSVQVILIRLLYRLQSSVVVWEHNIRTPRKFSGRQLKTILSDSLAKVLLALADGIIFNSPDTRDSFTRGGVLLPKRRHLIPNPISLDSSELPNPNDLDLPPSFFLAAGRLTHQKGFDLLLESFAQLGPSECHLVIAGEGPDLEKLTALSQKLGLSNRVKFVGQLPNIRPLMRQCEAFVLSSRWEGFGNVLVEALQEGSQVISFDCKGGPRWILGGGRYGVLVEPESTIRMSAAMREVIDEGRPHSKEEAVRRGRDFLPEVVGPQFEKEVLEFFLPDYL